MIKLCFVSLYSYKLFHPEKDDFPGFGGSEVQQFLLGKSLANSDKFKVSFMVGDFCKSQPSVEIINTKNDPITIYKSVKCRNRELLEGLFDFWRLFNTVRKINADIFIVRGGGSFTGKLAWITKIIFKKRLIYSSAHDRDSTYSETHSFLISRLFFYALKKADCVICQHREQQIALEKNLGIKAMVIKSMYPIDEHADVESAKKYILWVGRLVSWKQPELFLQLAKRMPKYRFVMITNSDTSIIQSKIDLIPNLTLYRNVPFASIDGFFKNAKLFVNTSIQEGFPNTFVQAAKNGVPILSLNVNPENIIKKHDLGRLTSGDFGKLVDDLEAILENNELWNNYSHNCRTYALQNHDQKQIIKQYEKLFYEIRNKD